MSGCFASSACPANISSRSTTGAKQQPDDQATIDTLIVRVGPAGLREQRVSARYRRSLVLVDEGESGAALIAESHNYPG